jgi:cell wall-associated NlpC family hydrolase
MGNETRLPLGRDVPVKARSAKPMRVGAFASVGIGGVDAVVSREQAAAIGLPRDRALVVSAPKGDPLRLRDQISALLPRGSHVEMLRVRVIVRDAGSYLTRAQIRTVLQEAAKQVGKPYVWGATGPDTFDCSGLVGWAFAKAGISMPRTTFQQWYAGPHVPLSDARPGDLLFWNYDPTAPDLPDHVAIYAGNGMELVATHTGDYVRYKAVPMDHLLGVVRVDPAAAARVGGPRF